jgi:phosphohistidine phosphatase
MLKVIMMRHAASQLEQHGKNDRERTITMAGMHEIDALRPKLCGQLEGVSLVLCSNVKRSRQTLEGIKQFIPVTADINYDDSIYQASADILWHKIQTVPPAHKTIMILGHNPSLTKIISAINPRFMSHFPTCGVVQLETKLSKWHEVSPQSFQITSFFDVSADTL